MIGITARIVLKQPAMLRVTISSNSARVVSHPVLPIGPEPPATLTRTSMRPKTSCDRAIAESTASVSVRSQAITVTSQPIPLAASDTGSMAATSRPTSASRQPSRAKPSVTAAPIPLAGPVMTATRPFNARSMTRPFSSS
jgi:hypothetical protein